MSLKLYMEHCNTLMGVSSFTEEMLEQLIVTHKSFGSVSTITVTSLDACAVPGVLF